MGPSGGVWTLMDIIQYSGSVYRFKFHKPNYIKAWKVLFARLNPLLLTSVLTIKKSKKIYKKNYKMLNF